MCSQIASGKKIRGPAQYFWFSCTPTIQERKHSVTEARDERFDCQKREEVGVFVNMCRDISTL